MGGVNGSGSWNLVSVRLVLMISSQMLNLRQNEENFCKNGVCRYFPSGFRKVWNEVGEVCFIGLEGQKEIGGFGQLAIAIIIHHMKIE